MQKAGEYIEPVAESIKGTYPSTSWQPKGSITELPWGVATRSTDDKREFIHVLNPPSTRTVSLPPPDDGKVFANARLLVGGKPVKLEQNASGLRLTLPEDEAFNPLDTVIVMDVVSKPQIVWQTVKVDSPDVKFGTREVFNNTATQPNDVARVEYHGNWVHQWRDGGEYERDIHYSGNNGDDFTIHFRGSGVMMVGNGLGEIDFFLDDKFLRRVNMNAYGNRPHIVGMDLTGLPVGEHRLKGVKVGGPWVQLDMFRVYNTSGGNWKRSGPQTQNRSTDRNEDFVQFSFTGPCVEVIAPKGPDHGTIEVFLDGQAVRNVNQYHGTPLKSATLVSLSNLTPGAHTLVLVKKRGGFFEVGEFRVGRLAER
jgi:hypothetical protein